MKNLIKTVFIAVFTFYCSSPKPVPGEPRKPNERTFFFSQKFPGKISSEMFEDSSSRVSILFLQEKNGTVSVQEAEVNLFVYSSAFLKNARTQFDKSALKKFNFHEIRKIGTAKESGSGLKVEYSRFLKRKIEDNSVSSLVKNLKTVGCKELSNIQEEAEFMPLYESENTARSVSSASGFARTSEMQKLKWGLLKWRYDRSSTVYRHFTSPAGKVSVSIPKNESDLLFESASALPVLFENQVYKIEIDPDYFLNDFVSSEPKTLKDSQNSKEQENFKIPISVQKKNLADNGRNKN
ncbi:MAG TPA: hypothetical protein PL163_13515 [Leptospiraceae bacterium]|nr:hypothetical protein [Leptospiraceae bacterium]